MRHRLFMSRWCRCESLNTTAAQSSARPGVARAASVQLQEIQTWDEFLSLYRRESTTWACFIHLELILILCHEWVVDIWILIIKKACWVGAESGLNQSHCAGCLTSLKLLQTDTRTDTAFYSQSLRFGQATWDQILNICNSTFWFSWWPTG